MKTSHYNLHYEDVISLLVSGIHPEVCFPQSEILFSLSNQITLYGGLTAKQRKLVEKIIKSYDNLLSDYYRIPHSILTNIKWKNPLRNPGKVVKSASIIYHDEFFKAIMLKFLHNDILVDMIRNLVDAYFSCSEKAWILPLNSNSIKFLLDIADLENYTLDEELERYIDQALEILKNMDDYIPCLILDNDLPKIRNSPKNLPELRSTEIVAAMFEARKLGITTWDSSVEHALQVEHLSNEALDFLKSGYMETTIIDSRKSEINSLKFLIDYMTPCLVIIPGGSELEKISEFSAFLKDCGMANEEISTMFRMSSEIGSDFNKFIKNNGLNNPITEKTKVVFVNVKFPKSVMKSKIRFNCTINLGTHPVHHTIKDYLKNNENLVLFVDRSKVKRMRKGELVW